MVTSTKPRVSPSEPFRDKDIEEVKSVTMCSFRGKAFLKHALPLKSLQFGRLEYLGDGMPDLSAAMHLRQNLNGTGWNMQSLSNASNSFFGQVVYALGLCKCVWSGIDALMTLNNIEYLKHLGFTNVLNTLISDNQPPN
ncbi:hypothetical protein BX616_004061 [Lobosporangium transversale]|uniref:RNase III domain-containing protein n=1 Tax=Lobosporangium transversale TaxID=64571 RepID=A0A1Y2GQ37_9FUNG|nr:hypothetical protein BCR41DRAFT_395627 [Lobosporangium transversale]KAF9898415.1 hypothetical protein BX616_004061 [Lobosporangium transversale]ORZ18391.1 hypothetical protein BCR41DRAFT_395627 [Lobosporangium transversale]|eukprot:XP_021882186.1 hypothetical protein BCR41DRAFT_395627 [Lobosporangium transversale]